MRSFGQPAGGFKLTLEFQVASELEALLSIGSSCHWHVGSITPLTNEALVLITVSASLEVTLPRPAGPGLRAAGVPLLQWQPPRGHLGCQACQPW